MSAPNFYYEKLDRDIEAFRAGRGILYFPMFAGAVKLGEPIEERLAGRGIAYRRLPVYFERKTSVIERPARRDVERARDGIKKVTGKEPAYFILDDVISEGR